MTTDARGKVRSGSTERIRPARRERPRVPLVLKIFLLTALLIVVVIGLSIGVTLQRANRIALDTVNKAISNAAALFDDFQKTRLQELELGALTLGRDPSFNSYVQAVQQGSAPPPPPTVGEAPTTSAEPTPATSTAIDAAAAPADGQPDIPSLIDQLNEKLQVLKSDLLIATNPDGVIIARSSDRIGQPIKTEDLYTTQPLVKAAIESPTGDPVSGVMAIDDRLYHAAVAPLNVGAGRVRTGFIINAYEINDRFANQIAKTTSAEVVFIPSLARKVAQTPIPRSTEAPGAPSLNSMGEVDTLLAGSRSLPPHEVKISGTRYVVTGEAMSAKARPVGAAIFLRSLDKELAPFRQIETTLLFAGGAALLVAFLLSWIVAKRLTRPIEDLVGYAQQVTEGDYNVQPEVDRSDEIGILSRTFAQMVSALRDKAELEELYAEMSARIEEREQQQPATVKVSPPRSEEATILVTDLRGVTPGAEAPEELMERVATMFRMQEAEIKRQEGVVREVIGHQLVATFEGERAVLHAVRAARAISEELSARGNVGVGVGIATGEFVTGSVSLTEENGLALVGSAPLLALLFAWEAPTGEAFISLESGQQLTGELASGTTRDEVRLRWLPAPVPVVALPLQSVTTGMMKAVGVHSIATMKTLRMEGDTDTPSPIASLGGSDLRVGSMFANRYTIEQIVGRGGMGVVYRAIDNQLDETVAIKTLPGDSLSRSPEELERFKREIRLARQITHRNVLRTFDYGEANGVYFISMEYVRGFTLSELLEENPKMALRPALGLTRQICRGLQAAHEEGIIHRDIKPQNVLVDQKGQVKLMDFGIARRAEAADGMTSQGLIVGTPHYMSPEQVQGKNLDARSDVYAMGVMMYEMLCGVRPFDSDSLMGVLTSHLTHTPPAPIEMRPDMGQQINRIILRCLEKDVAKRYANAGELLDELDRLQQVGAAAA